ncbi:TPA: restriction endonuclease subunit S [Escherichia coli]
MNEWDFLKIRQMGTVITGKTPSKNAPSEWGEDYNFVTPSDYRNYFKYARTSSRKLSELGFNSHKKRLIPKNSVLVTCIGSDMGKTVLNSSDCFTNQQINSLIPNNSVIDYDFAYYLFKNNEAVFKSLGSDGTAVPILNKSDFENIDFLIPDLPEQKAIASVLSSLDDKIDLLQRQNKTLESLANTMFRQWFVEGAPDDWETKPLSEVATFTNGLACQKFPAIPGKPSLPVLKIKELNNGISSGSDLATASVKENYIVNHGDVIFSWSASLMVKIWSGPICVLNQHLFKVSSDTYPKWFYFEWCKHYLEQFISISQSHATTMGHIKRQDLDEAMVKIPSNNELVAMTAEMEPLLSQRIENMRQIRTLECLRDTLLPKLMSGDIRVQYAEEAIASVA